jgi:PST family polysaccharide transporter
VYASAVRQGLYAALVVFGAFIGQRWGVGGVAVAVSIAMGINFVNMAALSRRETGLSWSRFARAHVPGALLAVLIGSTVAVTASLARAAHLGKIPVLVIAVLTGGLVTLGALRLHSELFLGPHGAWAFKHTSEFLRNGARYLVRNRAAAS